jgi:hypothetical protein
MRIVQFNSVTRLLWATMLVVVTACMAGVPEILVKECITQVLFLLSCAAASIVAKADFAQSSRVPVARDIEWGLDIMHQWSRTQHYTICICIMAVDASIMAYDRSEAVPRLLIAGILVLWLARYLASAVPSMYMTNVMPSLSTAILQAMLLEVGRPVATLLEASDPIRLLCTLAVTVFLILRQFGCELYVVLVIVASETPQLLLVGDLVPITLAIALIADLRRQVRKSTPSGVGNLHACSQSGWILQP